MSVATMLPLLSSRIPASTVAQLTHLSSQIYGRKLQLLLELLPLRLSN